MRVHLIGTLPPPHGGVSVHLHRLRRRLLAAGHACEVWGNHEDPSQALHRIGSSRDAHRRLRALPPEDLIHVHGNALLAGWLARARRGVLLTVHNARIARELGSASLAGWPRRALARRGLRGVPRVLAVSEEVREQLESLGVDRERIRVVNAFLPPEDDERSVPEAHAALDQHRSRYAELLTANASSLRRLDGTDLYGVDLCLEALAALAEERPQLGLVVALSDGVEARALEAHRERADALGIASRVLWLRGAGAYSPLLARCRVFLRPTVTDGFCLSIAEAFEAGVPVVASDAVARPAGCRLFRSRDAADLASRVEEVLDAHDAASAESRAAREPDHFDEILEAYRELAGS